MSSINNVLPKGAFPDYAFPDYTFPSAARVVFIMAGGTEPMMYNAGGGVYHLIAIYYE